MILLLLSFFADGCAQPIHFSWYGPLCSVGPLPNYRYILSTNAAAGCEREHGSGVIFPTGEGHRSFIAIQTGPPRTAIREHASAAPAPRSASPPQVGQPAIIRARDGRGPAPDGRPLAEGPWCGSRSR